MKRIQTTALLLAIVPVFFVSSGCDPKVEPKPPVAVAPPAIQPTAERALQRAQARWDNAVKNEWIAAYDFYAPEVKQQQPLATYMGGMQMHRYENMRATEVLAIQGDKAFVRSTGLWTPVAPQVQRVKLDPGQTLTQQISMIETWRFVDGDWCFMRPDREDDFFAAHPELLKAESKTATPPAK